MSAYTAMMDLLANEDATKIRELISNDTGRAAIAKMLQADEEELMNLSPDSQDATDSQEMSSQQERTAFLTWKHLTEAERNTVQTVMEDAGFPNQADDLKMDLNMMLLAY